jgi:predicted GNAT family acetyltransferase
MQVLHEDDNTNGRFYVAENNELLAEMTYKWHNDHVFIIEHTEVSDKLAGKGVGKQLVNAAVEFARANDYRIIPVCPFAAKVFEKTREYHDVLNQ